MDRNVYGGVLYARVSTLKHKFGKDGLREILNEMKKIDYSGPTEIAEIKPKQRYPVEYLQQMNQAILNIYGEEKFQQIARDTAKRKGIVGVFVKWAASLEMIMTRAPEYWSEFYDFGTMKTERIDGGYKLILHDAYVDPLFCKYLTNYYGGILVSANIRGEIAHTKCEGRGDSYCEWQVTTGEQIIEQDTYTKEEIEESGTYGSYRPEEVRDAILHCLIDMNMDKESARIMLKEQFKQADLSWNEPSKEGLQKIIDLLAQDAKNVRDDHTIQTNHNKIQKMIQLCDCRGRGRPVPTTETKSIPKPEQVSQSKPVEEQKPEQVQEKPKKEECPYLDNCPIFLQGAKDGTENTIAKMWCTSEDLYKKCIRKQLRDAGREVPKNLMPTGKYI